MSNLTTGERDALAKMKQGPASIPAIVFSKLRDKGFAEKAEGSSPKGRGYSFAKATAEGLKAAG